MSYKVPVKIIDIPQQGCHIICNLGVGSRNCNFIIDTGASMTVMDKKRYEFIYPDHSLQPYRDLFTGIGDAQKMEVFRGKLERITLGGLTLTSLDILLLNLDNINIAYARYDLERVEGILGGDVLKLLKAQIDYGSSTMHVFGE